MAIFHLDYFGLPLLLLTVNLKEHTILVIPHSFKKLILQISSTVRQLSNASNKECSLRRMRGTDQITLNQAINGTLINGSLSEIWFT